MMESFVNENRYLLNSLTKACRYQNDQVQTRLPIQRRLLQLIINQIQEQFADQLYLAMTAPLPLLPSTAGLNPTGTNCGSSLMLCLWIV